MGNIKPSINCEINLILTWSENCEIKRKEKRDSDPDADPAGDAVSNPTNATFKITVTKLYVSVITLSKKDHNRLLEQLKTGFKKNIKMNKYRSKMSKETKTNDLNYLIDPAFSKVNRLFVLSFGNEDDWTSFSKYYTPSVEIKVILMCQ